MPEDWRPRPLPGGDGLILYDGVCVLCSAFVRFVVARDRTERWRFVPVQSPYGRSLAATLGIDPENPQTVAALRDGTAHFKLDAATAVLRDWPVWRWTRLLTWLPRPLAERLYDLVARNRYRLFGRREACAVPPPHLAGRVLTEAP
jgi:predicted DCC family thiol-disulfide oxidoreductase YuxK